jgi:hypothetical protein
VNGTHPINRPLKLSRKSLELRCGVLLCYPDFNKPVLFHLNTDALDHQLGAVIMQNKKPIAFYLRKLNTAQKWYTTTDRDRELLSAIKTCKLKESGLREKSLAQHHYSYNILKGMIFFATKKRSTFINH